MLCIYTPCEGPDSWSAGCSCLSAEAHAQLRRTSHLRQAWGPGQRLLLRYPSDSGWLWMWELEEEMDQDTRKDDWLWHLYRQITNSASPWERKGSEEETSKQSIPVFPCIRIREVMLMVWSFQLIFKNITNNNKFNIQAYIFTMPASRSRPVSSSNSGISVLKEKRQERKRH